MLNTLYLIVMVPAEDIQSWCSIAELLHLLTTQCGEEALCELERRSFSDSRARVEIAKEGGVTPLIQFLSTGSHEAQGHAASVLGRLALNSANAIAIANEGGIKLLIRLLSTGSEEATEKAAGHYGT